MKTPMMRKRSTIRRLWPLVAALTLLGCDAGEPPRTDSEPQAMTVMSEFWQLVESNRFGETERLFADDIVFIDPIWGRYEGREAAGRFMKSFEGAGNGCCTLDRLAGDDSVGWGFWTLHTPDGPQSWVGVYQVTDGKIAFYRDFHERVYSEEEQAAHMAAAKAAASTDTPSED